jgi:hypothetical protein
MPLWVFFVPVIILVSFRNFPWGWAAFFIFASSFCQIILRSWNVLPVLSLSSLEKAVGCVWTVSSFFIIEGQIIWGFVALGIEACLMALAYRRNLQIGDIWGI